MTLYQHRKALNSRCWMVWTPADQFLNGLALVILALAALFGSPALRAFALVIIIGSGIWMLSSGVIALLAARRDLINGKTAEVEIDGN